MKTIKNFNKLVEYLGRVRRNLGEGRSCFFPKAGLFISLMYGGSTYSSGKINLSKLKYFSSKGK